MVVIAGLYGRFEEIVGAHNRRLYGDHPIAESRVDRMPNASADAYSLCKPGTLREWGAEQIARFNGLVGGGNLHIHENSRHVIEEGGSCGSGDLPPHPAPLRHHQSPDLAHDRFHL